MNAAEEQFGWHSIESLVREQAVGSARELVLRIRQALERFTGGQPLIDDVTIVAIRILG